MLKTGILNPQVNALLARVRHTNTLVIADRGFPSWPTKSAGRKSGVRSEELVVETNRVSRDFVTIDLSLVDDIPTVLQVFDAIRKNFSIARVHMAREFLKHNDKKTVSRFKQSFGRIRLAFEPHVKFKKRVPGAVGLIRTADTIQYANLILTSG